MSLAHLGKTKPFGGGCTFSKGSLPGMECNFTVIVSIREEGQEGYMRVGWAL